MISSDQKGFTNTVLSVIAALVTSVLVGFGSYSLNSIFNLQAANTEIKEKVAEVQIEIAGKYISKNDLNGLKADIMQRLDRMEHRLMEKNK